MFCYNYSLLTLNVKDYFMKTMQTLLKVLVATLSVLSVICGNLFAKNVLVLTQNEGDFNQINTAPPPRVKIHMHKIKMIQTYKKSSLANLPLLLRENLKAIKVAHK